MSSKELSSTRPINQYMWAPAYAEHLSWIWVQDYGKNKHKNAYDLKQVKKWIMCSC